VLWQSLTKRSIELPCLRDLRLWPFLSLVEHWKLPCLRSVTDSYYHSAWPDHDHVVALHKALLPHCESIIQFTFQGEGSRLRTMWEIVGHLPCLQHLRFTTMYGFHVSDIVLAEPHPSLQIITLFGGHSESSVIGRAMDNVLMNVDAEKLPLLRELRVWGGMDRVELVERRRAACQMRALSLEISDITWSEWSE